jgi:hypothetical protein
MRSALRGLILLALVGRAQAAVIEPRNPTYPLSYCLTLAPDQPTSFWVVLHPDGATNIIGARLRITGLPTGCSVAVTPSASATSSNGDLFSTGGAEILFSNAQTSASVTLFEVTLSCPASALLEYVTLQPDTPLPSPPGLECPLVILADTPAPAYACAEHTTLSNHPLWCEIRVAPTSWSAAKSLFR